MHLGEAGRARRDSNPHLAFSQKGGFIQLSYGRYPAITPIAGKRKG
jgi:hypothetical protein